MPLTDSIFRNWHGQNSDNSRPVIRLECDPDVPCYDITVDDVALWTWDGDEVFWSCQNAYGEGACLKSTAATANLATYTTAVTTGKPQVFPSVKSSITTSTDRFSQILRNSLYAFRLDHWLSDHDIHDHPAGAKHILSWGHS